MAVRPWHELTTNDFAELDASRAVAILQVAAVEQHGPHLPVGVDAIINDGILAAAAARMAGDPPVLLLPMQWVGKSDEHIAFPGTLTVTGATTERVWAEIGASVARAGLRKLLIFNSHGGQIATGQLVARSLRREHGMLVVSVIWPQLGLPEGIVDAEEARFGIHGGDIETSLMLALRPELCRMELARDFVPATRQRAGEVPVMTTLGAAGFGWLAQDLHPSGAAGDAAAATAEKGERILGHVAERLAALVREIADLPLPTT